MFEALLGDTIMKSTVHDIHRVYSRGRSIHHLKAQPLFTDTSKEICWGEAWGRLGMMRGGGVNQRINDNTRSMV